MSEPYKAMHTRTLEEFEAEEKRIREWRAANWPADTTERAKESDNQRNENRQEKLKDFPFTCIVEGSYPEIDHATYWCWQHFGAMHGKCGEQHSEYPGCPLVRATEYITEGSWKDKEGKEHKWTSKEYKEVEPHEHEGTWCEVWLGKTGYDYGNAEFYFKSEADRDAFVTAVPTIGFGERYN